MIEILDVKAAPEMVSIINQSRGYLPAYHMNKTIGSPHTRWLCIRKQLQSLLRDSYERTVKPKYLQKPINDAPV